MAGAGPGHSGAGGVDLGRICPARHAAQRFGGIHLRGPDRGGFRASR